jgi:hypothetical protein
MMKHNGNVSDGEGPDVRVKRLLDGPIISSDLHPSIGPNIQGPSLIKAPEWIEGRLGDWYPISQTTRAATFGSHTQITCWDRGESTHPALCSSRSRVF